MQNLIQAAEQHADFKLNFIQQAKHQANNTMREQYTRQHEDNTQNTSKQNVELLVNIELDIKQALNNNRQNMM